MNKFNYKKRDIRKEVADIVIKQMESAGSDWIKTWKASVPISKSTNKEYNGINVLLLQIYAGQNKYNSNEWATYDQWFKLGGGIKELVNGKYKITKPSKYSLKGQKGQWITFYKKIEVQPTPEELKLIEEGYETDSKHRAILKSFYVYNADQVEGYEAPAMPESNTKPDTLADKLAADVRAKVFQSDLDRCFYSLKDDSITMTKPQYFDTKENYACTLLHELTHWTRNKSESTKRNFGKARFGNGAYAMEELVAELGSAMLAGQLGISNKPREDHAKYLNGWIKAIKQDSNIIFKMASFADKATKYLLDKQESATKAKQLDLVA